MEGRGEKGGQMAGDGWKALSPASAQHPNDLDGLGSFTGPNQQPVAMETAANIPESPTNLSHKIQKTSWNIKLVNQLFIFQQ